MNTARATSAWNYAHMPGFEEYGRKSKKGHREANRVNLLKKINEAGKSKTHCQVRNLVYLQESIKKLK